MGIWATYVPVGSILMYNIAPALGAAAGWQAVWWFGAAFALVAFVLYGVLLRTPPALVEAGRPKGPGEGAAPAEPPNLGRAMSNLSMWLLSLEFLCFNLVFFALITFFPTFLVSNRAYDLPTASFVSSLTMIVTVLSCPLAGWISDRIGSRRLVYTIPFLVAAAMWFLPFNLTGWLIPAFMIVLGLVAGAIPTATFAAVPEVMKRPQLAGIGMAVLAFGQNLGAFIGPVMFGKLTEATDWATAGYLLIPICLIGVLAGWFVKVR